MRDKNAPYNTMLKSRIHPQVEYESKRMVHPEDCRVELSVYELNGFDKDFLVALGKPKYNFASKGVHYVPIYFVPSNTKNDKVQIGVYEYEKDRSLEILDTDGDIDIDQLVPIFYPFAEEIVKNVKSNVQEFLSKSSASIFEPIKEGEEVIVTEEKEEEEEEGDDDDDVLNLSKKKTGSVVAISQSQEKIDKTLKKGVFTIDPNVAKLPILTEESKDDSEEIKQKFVSDSAHNLWIQEFMHNPYYDIHQVEANGDCFFATIRDAFKQIGHQITVSELRALLAKEVTEDIFQENRKLFLDLEGSIKEYEQEMERAKQGNLQLKKQYKIASTADREVIRKESVKLLERSHELKELKESTQAMIDESMGNLSNIRTFEQYRQHLMTTSYWADSWAISTLEKILNIKMIIFSELYYNEDAPHSVLNCGEANKDLEKQGKFEPQYYIMTSYSGNHYNLISYKGKKILIFSEIPYDVKAMIVNKCIEKSAGIYYLIQEFRDYKVRLGIQADVGAPDVESDDEVEVDEDEPGQEGVDSQRSRRGSIDKHELYDSSIVFRFFTKSEKTALPGKGTGEIIPKDKMMDYKDLKTIPDWRRKLDDTWISEEPAMEIGGHKYASVEHYYQASKFVYPGSPKQNNDFALLFSIDSSSKIAKDVAIAKAAGGKSGKMKGSDKKDVILRPKDVTIDPNFYEGRNKKERMTALMAKFGKIPEMTKLLKMTKRAKLVHYIAKQPPEIDVQLMEVRKRITQNNN